MRYEERRCQWCGQMFPAFAMVSSEEAHGSHHPALHGFYCERCAQMIQRGGGVKIRTLAGPRPSSKGPKPRPGAEPGTLLKVRK